MSALEYCELSSGFQGLSCVEDEEEMERFRNDLDRILDGIDNGHILGAIETRVDGLGFG